MPLHPEGIEGLEQCCRCHVRQPENGSECAVVEARENGVRVFADGWLLTPNDALYCPDCVATLRICRGCGCTDEAGCSPCPITGRSCAWVALEITPGRAVQDPDLCDRCIDYAPVLRGEPATLEA